jgi:hypothetical protein
VLEDAKLGEMFGIEMADIAAAPASVSPKKGRRAVPGRKKSAGRETKKRS